MRVLVPDSIDEQSLRLLERHADVVRFGRTQKPSKAVLSEVDAMIVSWWPQFLDAKMMKSMCRLKFIQTTFVGVNQVPFGTLPSRVKVSSNSGAYSVECGEFVWALILAGAKKVVRFNNTIKEGEREMRNFRPSVGEVMVLEGKTLGIVGYGGIGRYVAKLGRAFGMRLTAWVRSGRRERGVDLCSGRAGLRRLLAESDVVVLSVPLTNATRGMMGRQELGLMKEEAVLVNIARGDLVDERAIYRHLRRNPRFTYATDVWWSDGGGETLVTKHPLAGLPNFVGTPHMSGPSALASKRPMRAAVRNAARFLGGREPFHVINKGEYL